MAENILRSSIDTNSSEPNHIFSSIICENVRFLGSKQINSPCDLNQIKDAVKCLFVKVSELGKTVSLLFSLSDVNTFSIVDCQTGEHEMTFDTESMLFYSQCSVDSCSSFFVLTFKSNESPLDPIENGNLDVLAPTPSEFDNPTTQLEYTCYVFQCKTSFEASNVVKCLFRISRQLSDLKPSSTQLNLGKPFSSSKPEEYIIGLRLTVDIREDDPRAGTFTPVPKDRQNLFKLRMNIDKYLLIGITHLSGTPVLSVRRCLGVGLAFGRFIQDVDMTALSTNPDGLSAEESASLVPGASFVTKAMWSTEEPQFKLLNSPTDRDRFVFFTVVCHLLFDFIAEPVSFYCVCRARVFRQEETFWLPSDRRPCSEDIQLHLSSFADDLGRIFLNRLSVSNIVSPYSDVMRSLVQTESGDARDSPETARPDEESDGDEPLVSGNGIISKEIKDSDMMVTWAELIADWRVKLNGLNNETSSVSSFNTPFQSPDSETALTIGPDIDKLGSVFCRRILKVTRLGIPDTLRADTWQLLAGRQNIDAGLLEVYRILSTKPCQFDADIQRDLPRTFPAHDFFKEKQGQQILFKLNRIYALYDEDVGYCQGVSFIVAALLLYLSEEQAFCLLVKIMSYYGVRYLFMRSCDGLFRSLYQLERLIQDQLPDVARAFQDVGIETHMYASQWFLSLFTAKFPLNLVFHILDLFLAEGLLFIFKVMITLLRTARRDLLGLDFEGTLKYFRVTLPKRFRSPEASEALIASALSSKVTSKKLALFARDWTAKKAQEDAVSSPLRLLQRESWQLRDQCSRLEKENETLAEELLVSKTNMQKEVEKLEDSVETLRLELFSVQNDLVDKQEECNLMEKEISQVKNMFRTTLEKHAIEHQHQNALIEEYRAITSNLSKRLEDAEHSPVCFSPLPVEVVRAVVRCSGECRAAFDVHMPGWDKADNSLSPLPVENSNEDDEAAVLRRRIRELELDLAHKKVLLVDEQCQRQDLGHTLQMTNANLELCRQELEAARNSNPKLWLAKKWTNIRTGTAPVPPDSLASNVLKSKTQTLS